MAKRHATVLELVLTLLAALFSAACSTVPKRPVEIDTQRRTVAAGLDFANRETERGNYVEAWEITVEARRIAVSTDDPPLLIKTGLCQGNILYFMGRWDEAEAAWKDALAEAERSGDGELAAVCRIYRARARLLDLAAGRDREGSEEMANAPAIRSLVMADLPRIKSDPLFTALGWIVAGLAEREGRRWDEAEAAVKKALAIHSTERYLEQCAYDWYLIASIRSLAGRYTEALDALAQALDYDRRAENSYGLGKDWLAMGEVYNKAGKRPDAEAAYRRAAGIFRAASFEEDAEDAERRLARGR